MSQEQINRRQIIEQSIHRASTKYIETRLCKIDDFVSQHYSLKGSLRIHCHAFGWDLIRVPINIVWIIFRLAFALIGLVARLLRINIVSDLIKKLPYGFETATDRQIKWLISTELLELPYYSKHRKSDKDALFDNIINDPELSSLLEKKTENIKNPDIDLQALLTKKMADYSATRIGTSDLASNILILFSSQLALGKVAYGSFGASSLISVAIANYMAVSNFWLGTTAGNFFYNLFPAKVSFELYIIVLSAVALFLAFFSTFIGILADPLQAKLGLHQNRLRKLILSIEKDLTKKKGGELHLHEKYIGRVFDIIDYITVLGRSI